MVKKESRMISFVSKGFSGLSTILNCDYIPKLEPKGWYIVFISSKGITVNTTKEAMNDESYIHIKEARDGESVDYYVHNVLFQRDVKVKKKKKKNKKKKNKKNKNGIVKSSSKNIMV